MPTQTPIADDDGGTGRDVAIPEVDAELDASDHDGLAAFLHAVRGMVHGPEGQVPAEAPRDPLGSTARADSDDTAVAEEELGEWLPGVWSTAEQRPGRRRGPRRSERRSERRAERRAGRRAESRVPVQRASTTGPDLLASPVEPEAASAPRRTPRRERRQHAARALAAAVPIDELLTDGTGDERDAPAGAVAVSTKPRRRVRRETSVEAQAQVEEVAADPEDVQASPVTLPGTGRPRPTRVERRRERARVKQERAQAKEIAAAVARGESDDRPDDRETLGEYVARVDASILPRRTRRSRPRTPRWFRRTVRVTAVGALIAACVALPWVAPEVPRLFGDLVPETGAPSSQVEDEPVAPSTEVFTGPVGVGQQGGPLAGVRLQAAGPPRQVVVPRLHVDSVVVPISGQSGTLLPPDDPQVLGWWREGKPVGAQYGTAVVTGHTVHTGGGALDDLAALVVGDTFRVRTDRGWIRYAVQRTRIYSTAELARDAEKIFRLTGPGRLLLITCDDWNGEFYESNAIVVAAPVDDQPYVSDGETAIPDSGTVEGGAGASGNMDGSRGVVPAKMFDR